MAQERLGNNGYLALKKEATKGVAVIPNDFIPLYEESLITKLNLVEDKAAFGNKFVRFAVQQGQRSHTGGFTCMMEPNTFAKLMDATLHKTSTTGSDPYAHQYNLVSTDPNSYTIDIGTVTQVFRFMGFQIESVKPVLEGNEWRVQVKGSALKAFAGREIASVASAVVQLKTDYDPNPTDGLVASDLIQIYDVDLGTYQNFTVVSVDSGVQVTLSGSPATITGGDFLQLRPASPSFATKTPFLWSRTNFCLGVDAATALSATPTPHEKGSEIELIHSFENSEGAMRSGSFDPASLPRTQADLKLTLKRFFDTPEDVERFTNLGKQALVIRMYSEAGYEARFTINNFKVNGGAKPLVKSEGILYYQLDCMPIFDQLDGQALDVLVINHLSTI